MKKIKIKILLTLGVIILGFSFNNARAANHDFTGLLLTADGWTDIEALVQPDSRIIYVSTSGNDATGSYNLPTDEAVTGEYSVLEPNEAAIFPYQTLAAGYAQLRDGYPDFLLLKRGDDFGSYNLEFNKSGESQIARMVVAAYGATSVARPITGQVNPHSNGVSYLVIADLQLDDEERGMASRGSINHVLIEGCFFPPGPDSGASISDDTAGYGEETIDYLGLRRNVFAGRYRPSGSTAYRHGLYIHGSKNLLIEENIFDDNGHDEFGAEMNAQDLRSHNTYIMLQYSDEPREQIWRGNISSRASSHCYQPGQGGEFYGNLAVECPIAIQTAREDTWYAGVSGAYEKNVVLHGRDINSTERRGWGFVVSNADGQILEDNIVADNNESRSPAAFYASTQLRVPGDPELPSLQMLVTNTTLVNNIVHNWNGDDTVTEAAGINLRGTDGGHVSNIILDSNRVHLTRSSLQVLTAGPYQPIISSLNNSFYTTQAVDEQFYLGSRLSFSEYQTLVSDSTSNQNQTNPSADYGITNYLTSIGDVATMESFYTNLRSQRKGNWDTDYTAPLIINFVRDKFGRDPVSYSYSSIASNYRADVDNSGSITSADALLALRNSLGLDMSVTAWQTSATTGDVNCDGSATSADALLLLRYSLGLDMSETGWCE